MALPGLHFSPCLSQREMKPMTPGFWEPCLLPCLSLQDCSGLSHTGRRLAATTSPLQTFYLCFHSLKGEDEWRHNRPWEADFYLLFVVMRVMFICACHQCHSMGRFSPPLNQPILLGTHRSTFVWFLFVSSSSWFPHFDRRPRQGSKCSVVMHVQPTALTFLCFCQVQTVRLTLGVHRCMCADVFSRFVTLDTQWLIYLDIYIFCILHICMRFLEKLLHCEWIICLFCLSYLSHPYSPVLHWFNRVKPYKLGYINVGLELW